MCSDMCHDDKLYISEVDQRFGCWRVLEDISEGGYVEEVSEVDPRLGYRRIYGMVLDLCQESI